MKLSQVATDAAQCTKDIATGIARETKDLAVASAGVSPSAPMVLSSMGQSSHQFREQLRSSTKQPRLDVA